MSARLAVYLLAVKDLLHGGLLMGVFMFVFASVLRLSTAYTYLAVACVIFVLLGWAVVGQLQVREAPERLTDKYGKELP